MSQEAQAAPTLKSSQPLQAQLNAKILRNNTQEDELESAIAIEALTAKFNAKVANHKLCMVQLERVTGECTALTSDLANCKEDNVMIRVKKAESDLSEKNQELCNAMEEITSLKNSLVSESCQKAVQDKLLSNTQSFLETVIGELVLES